MLDIKSCVSRCILLLSFLTSLLKVTIRHHAVHHEDVALHQKHPYNPMTHDSYDQTTNATNNNYNYYIFSKHEHVIHPKERTLGPPSVKNKISWKRNPSKLYYNSNYHQDKKSKKRTWKETHSEAFRNIHERDLSKMNEGDEQVYHYKRCKCGQSVSRRKMYSNDTWNHFVLYK